MNMTNEQFETKLLRKYPAVVQRVGFMNFRVSTFFRREGPATVYMIGEDRFFTRSGAQKRADEINAMGSPDWKEEL